MHALKKYAAEVIEEIAAADPRTRKIYDHVLAFKKNIINWNKVSENAIGPYLS
jgi:TRAP-type mannitol/chloroaromatic compound transport system substrate-binding protein